MLSECHLGGLAGVGEGSKVANNPEPTCIGEKPVLKNTLPSLLLASLFFFWLPCLFLSLAQCFPTQRPVYLSYSFACYFQEYVFTSSWHNLPWFPWEKKKWLCSFNHIHQMLRPKFSFKKLFYMYGLLPERMSGYHMCAGRCLLASGLTDKCE